MHPFLHITDDFVIPTYILVISLTYCLCLLWADRRARELHRSRNTALDIALAIMVGGFIGARLFHAFYEYPEVYLADPIRIIKFWQGGFVFYGGFIGALVTAVIFIRAQGEAFLEWADFYAPILALGYALGRVGCFLNGCCYGKTCDLPWAVEFNFPGLPVGLRHPTQIYATFTELLVVGILILLEKKWAKRQTGMVFFIWLALHALGRLQMEYFREDFRGPNLGLSISSWISIAILITSLFMMFSKFLRARSKAPQ